MKREVLCSNLFINNKCKTIYNVNIMVEASEERGFGLRLRLALRNITNVTTGLKSLE